MPRQRTRLSDKDFKLLKKEGMEILGESGRLFPTFGNHIEDYIKFDVYDLADTYIKSGISEDFENDGHNINLKPGNDLRKVGFVRGDYKVKYFFYRRLAGADEVVLTKTVGDKSGIVHSGDPKLTGVPMGDFYVDGDGKVFQGNEPPADGSPPSELDVKEYKFLIDEISADKKEVRLSTLSINLDKYKDEFYSLYNPVEVYRPLTGVQGELSFGLFTNMLAGLTFNNGQAMFPEPYKAEFQFKTIADKDPGFNQRMLNGTLQVERAFITGYKTEPETSENSNWILEQPLPELVLRLITPPTDEVPAAIFRVEQPDGAPAPSGNGFSYYWDFDDGNTEMSGPVTSHVFDDGGSGNVTAVVNTPNFVKVLELGDELQVADQVSALEDAIAEQQQAMTDAMTDIIGSGANILPNADFTEFVRFDEDSVLDTTQGDPSVVGGWNPNDAEIGDIVYQTDNSNAGDWPNGILKNWYLWADTNNGGQRPIVTLTNGFEDRGGVQVLRRTNRGLHPGNLYTSPDADPGPNRQHNLGTSVGKTFNVSFRFRASQGTDKIALQIRDTNRRRAWAQFSPYLYYWSESFSFVSTDYNHMEWYEYTTEFTTEYNTHIVTADADEPGTSNIGKMVGGASFQFVAGTPTNDSDVGSWFEISDLKIYQKPGTDAESGTVILPTHNIQFNAQSGGTVSTPTGNYEHNSLLEISATPASGHEFVQWNDTSGANQFTDIESATTFVNVLHEATISAQFMTSGGVPNRTVTLSGTIQYGSTGQYRFNIDGANNLSTKTVPQGTQVTIEAVWNSSDPNTEFIAWNDGNEEQIRTITLNNNMNLSATFGITV
jgi:hypothetical protein